MPIRLPKLTKICENQPCTKKAMRGERYCESCRHYILTQMRRDGYLKDPPGQRRDFS